jgi:hypothetical protein
MPAPSRKFEYQAKTAGHIIAIRPGTANHWDVWWDNHAWLTYVGTSPDAALDALTMVPQALPEMVQMSGSSMTLSLPTHLSDWQKVSFRK